MAGEQEVMGIEAGVGVGRRKLLVQREQLVEQSRSAAPVPHEEKRWPELEPVQGTPVQPLLNHSQRGQRTARQVKTRLERAFDPLRMTRADTSPCGEIQIERGPRPRARIHGAAPGGTLL